MQKPVAPATEAAPEIAETATQQAAGEYLSIAVLAFADLSPQRDQEYFSDGIAEELLNVLARDTDLRVAARTSSFAFKGKEQTIAAIGKALNVDAVLEGSVRKAGDKLRITAQLIDAQSGFHLWSQTYDREFTDIFAVQDEIAQAIVGSLPSSGAPREVAALKQTNRKAYELYLRGRHQLLQRTGSSIGEAQNLFEQSLMIDGSYAPAWADLAMSALLLHVGSYGDLDLDETVAIAGPAIEKALTIDPLLAEAHTAKGLLLGHQRHAHAAIAAYRRSIQLNPSTPNARHLLYLALLRQGKFREAYEVIDRAAAYDPLSAITLENLVTSLSLRGRSDDALIAARRLSDLHPDWLLAKSALANAYNETGRFAEAGALLEQASEAAQPSFLDVRVAFQLMNIKAFDSPLVKNAPVDPASFLDVTQGNHEQARTLVMRQLAREPDNIFFVWRAGWTLWAIDDAPAALKVFEDFLQSPNANALIVTPTSCYPGLYIAGLYRQSGDPAAAQPILDRCRETIDNMSVEGYVPLFFERDMVVELMVLEGRYDDAIAELRTLADSGRFISWWIEFEPIYQPLRDDPRFQEILADLNAFSEREQERYLATR